MEEQRERVAWNAPLGGPREDVDMFSTSIGVRMDYAACLAYLVLPPAGPVALLIFEHRSDYVRYVWGVGKTRGDMDVWMGGLISVQVSCVAVEYAVCVYVRDTCDFLVDGDNILVPVYCGSGAYWVSHDACVSGW